MKGKFQILILLSSLFLIPSLAKASVNYDNSSTAYTNGASSLTWSHTTGSGSDRVMAIACSIDSATQNVISVTYNGTNATLVGTFGSSSDRYGEIWKLLSPDSGSHNVSVTLAGSSAFVCYAISVDSSSDISGFTSSTGGGGAGTSSSVTVTSATGDLVFDILSVGAGKVPSAGVGQTQYLAQDSSNNGGYGSTKAGASSVNMTWSFSSSYYGYAGANFQAGTQGGGGGSPLISSTNGLVIVASGSLYTIQNAEFLFYTDYIIIGILILMYVSWLFLNKK